MTNEQDKIELTRSLEQDAKIVEVWMPQIEKQVDQDAVKAFIEDLRLWMAENKVSWAVLAEKTGINPGQLSNLRNGKYAGDAASHIQKIKEFQNIFASRKRVEKGNGFVDTTIARRIFTVIKQTQAFSDEHEAMIALVVGDSGHGKSVCLKQYAKVNLNTAYVELDDTMTAAAMFAEIAKALRIDSTGGTKTLTERIVNRLAGREMTIIIDEASALDVRRLNMLRQIFSIRCKCPLIIGGNAHLLSTINQDVTRRGYESLDQFRSRLLCVANLDAIASGDNGGGLYTAEDIKGMFEYGGVRLTKGAVKLAQKITRTPQTGRLRTCSIIISSLHKSRAVKEEQIITEDYMLAAIQQLGLPIYDRLPVLVSMDSEDAAEARVKTA